MKNESMKKYVINGEVIYCMPGVQLGGEIIFAMVRQVSEKK